MIARFAVVLGAVLVFVFTTDALGQYPRYGIVTSVFDSPHAAKIDELGAGSVRLGLTWALIQPERGVWDWATTDRWVANARALHLQIYAGLGPTPLWAGPCESCLPDSLKDWVLYVSRVIERYQGDDIVFGIWNEPNLRFFLNPNEPATYAQLFYGAHVARMTTRPGARLAAPETDGFAYFGWFQDVLARLDPFLQPQDVITVHWYGGPVDLDRYMTQILQWTGGRETWLTETGYGGGCSEQGQADWLTDILTTFTFNVFRSNWTKIFPYVLHNAGETCEGFVRPDWSNKPVFERYRAHIRGLAVLGAVSLQAENGQFLAAEDGGGREVAANRDGIGPWETFRLTDVNGGSLEAGDLVRITTDNGRLFSPVGVQRSVRVRRGGRRTGSECQSSGGRAVGNVLFDHSLVSL